MINLLPISTKRQLRAARANVLLLRYTVLLAVTVAFLALGTLSVYFVMGAIKANAENTAGENQSQISDFTAVQAAASEFRANLATAKAITDKEVIYSDTILSIAQVVPPGVILSNLSLDATSFGTPMTINAKAKSYERAISLKNSFEQSDIFSNVHFTSIANDATQSEAGEYKYSVILSATLSKKEPN